MKSVLADNIPLLFYYSVWSPSIKAAPHISGAQDHLIFWVTLRKAQTVITEHSLIGAVHSVRVSGD